MIKKIRENNRIKILFIALVTILIVAGFSFAWFMLNSGDITQPFKITRLEAEPDCYFEITEGERKEITDYLNADKTIKLSIDENDDNFIGNFRVDVKYKGRGTGYIRVKMAHQFVTDAGSSQNTTNVPYILKSDFDAVGDSEQAAWYDNRKNDYCYYYATSVKGSKDESKTINMITGINTDSSSENYFDFESIAKGVEISVAVEADAVQVNRYPQRWGLEKLPWK